MDTSRSVETECNINLAKSTGYGDASRNNSELLAKEVLFEESE